MSDIRRNWKIAGGVLLAAAIGLPAVRGEPPGTSRVAPVEPAPLPAAGPTEPLPPLNGNEPQYYTYYNPVRRPGLFGRIRQRIRDDFNCFKARQQATHWGYPEEFERPPVGSALYWNLTEQKAIGRPSRMTLHEFDFVPGSDQLKPRGQRELARISSCLPSGTCPILVEPTPGHPDLNEARRQTVWRELAGGQYPVPLERVVVARPQVRSLDDAESQLMEDNRMTMTRTRGVSSSSAASGTSSLGSGSSTGR